MIVRSTLLTAYDTRRQWFIGMLRLISHLELGYDNRLGLVDRVAHALHVLRDKVLGQMVGIKPAEFGDLSVQRQNTADNLCPE